MLAASLRIIRLVIFAIVVPIAVVVWIVVVPIFDVVASALSSLTARVTSRTKSPGTEVPDVTLEASDLASPRSTSEDAAARTASGSVRQAS